MFAVRRQGAVSCVAIIRALLVSLLLFYVTPSYAQGSADIASPVIDRDRPDRVDPQVLKSGPDLSKALRAQSESAASAAVVSLVPLTGVRFKGASLSKEDLSEAVQGYIGQPMTQATLQGVANAIARFYATSDIAYYSVKIPSQTPKGGILRIDVVEGRLVEYRLKKRTRSTPNRLIASQMRRIIGIGSLRKSQLDRTLSLLQGIPGQTVRADIAQLNAAGDLALNLSVERKQLQFNVTVDNSGISNVVSGVQAQLAVTGNGLLREGDSTRIALAAPFNPGRYQFYSLNHTTPLGSDGLILSANVAHSRTKAQVTEIAGRTTLAGISINYPLLRNARQNLAITISLDGLNSTNYYLDLQFGQFKTRTLRAGISYSRTSERTGYAASTVVSQGLDALGADPLVGFSDASFRKINGQALVAHKIYKDISVKMLVKGQYTNEQLPSTERFSFGGRNAGQAFRAGQSAVDRAVSGSVEISWQLPSKIPLGRSLTLFAYADGAYGRSLARPLYRLPQEDIALASAGGGVRAQLGKSFQANFEVAVPVKKPSDRFGASPRFIFGVTRSI